MRRKSICTTALLLLTLATPLVGKSAVFDHYTHALGVQGGRLAGFGASYQKWYPSFGFQIAGGAFFHPNMEEGRDRFAYNIGAEVQYPLISHTITSFLAGRVYLAAGLHHRRYQEAEGDETIGYTPADIVTQFGAGAGIGVETVLFEHFSLGTEFVYIGLYTTDGTIDVEMSPQLSIRYRF